MAHPLPSARPLLQPSSSPALEADLNLSLTPTPIQPQCHTLLDPTLTPNPQQVDLPSYALFVYMEEAVPKPDELKERARSTWSTLRRNGGTEQAGQGGSGVRVLGAQEPGSVLAGVNESTYEIDPEVFKDTKRNGIKSEAWF